MILFYCALVIPLKHAGLMHVLLISGPHLILHLTSMAVCKEGEVYKSCYTCKHPIYHQNNEL